MRYKGRITKRKDPYRFGRGINKRNKKLYYRYKTNRNSFKRTGKSRSSNH